MRANFSVISCLKNFNTEITETLSELCTCKDALLPRRAKDLLSVAAALIVQRYGNVHGFIIPR